jgi:hypothetical protein
VEGTEAIGSITSVPIHRKEDGPFLSGCVRYSRNRSNEVGNEGKLPFLRSLHKFCGHFLRSHSDCENCSYHKEIIAEESRFGKCGKAWRGAVCG